MSILAAIYNIQADLATWWTEEYVIQEKEGEGEPEPVDLTGKIVTFEVGGKVLKEVGSEEEEGLTVNKAEGKIVAHAYVVPTMKGQYRLDIRDEGGPPPGAEVPFTPIWGRFDVLGPPQ